MTFSSSYRYDFLGFVGDVLKNLTVFGSTGSIGQQTLRVVKSLPGEFRICALASFGRNLDLFSEQIRAFSPEVVSVYEPTSYQKLRKLFPNLRVLCGEEGLIEIATLPQVDMVVAASSGIAALPAILATIRGRKILALANKEILVAAGEIVNKLVKETGATILPIDSEHNALFQCLEGKQPHEVKKMLLTASGGPLLHKSKEELKRVSVAEVLRHPIWNMGAKISVDSSTLINKGLEMIEAYWLFGGDETEIDAVIHPQGIVHGMVEMLDGITLAVMNPPSMLFPIQHVLTYPKRCKSLGLGIDFAMQQRLDFSPIDVDRFPSICMAKSVLEAKGSAGSFFNAANEVLVHRFLDGKISWCAILTKLEKVMEKHRPYACDTLEELLIVDQEARALAQEI